MLEFKHTYRSRDLPQPFVGVDSYWIKVTGV